MRTFFTTLVFIFLLALTAHAQNNPANNSNTESASNTVSIDPNNRPTEPIKLVVSSGDGQSQGMNPWWKDFFDVGAKLGTLMGIIITASVAINQFRRNRELRENELEGRNNALEQRKVEWRWKKAELAKTVLNEMFNNPYAVDAMAMLDWGARDYDIKITRGSQATVEKVTRLDVWAALRVTETKFDPKERYIRDCFDQFFGVMQILQHYIEINLIEFKDVTYPFAYHMDIMNKRRRAYEYFINEYHPKAGEFLKNFPEWKKFDPAANSSQAYFMFDCPPGTERFFLMLEDPDKIEKAREIVLSGKKELHVTGQLVDASVSYNEPWDFHLEPSSIDFIKSADALAERINERVARQRQQVKAAFNPGNIWHYGGARLLAEVTRSS